MHEPAEKYALDTYLWMQKQSVYLSPYLIVALSTRLEGIMSF
jgi:hypothetical protein